MRAVCLLSGGLDSSTALAWALSKGYDCSTLAFDYGQRHRRELESSIAVSERLGASQHRTVRFDLRAFGGSSLTSDLPVPVVGVQEGIIPNTYVPARNTIFLSFALAYAEARDADDIVLGINAWTTPATPTAVPSTWRQCRGWHGWRLARGWKGGRRNCWRHSSS